MNEDLERKLQGLTPAQRALFFQLQQQRQQKVSDVSDGATPLQQTAPPADYALSFAQQRFWLLEQLHPAEPAHHLSGILVLTGSLDQPALQAAVARVVARHETLRTSFEERDGDPRAIVNEKAHCPIEYEDVSGLALAEQERVRSSLLVRCTSTPFDLRQPPLLRAQLVRLGAESWQLFWCVHHIAADGLSMLQLAADLEREYAALATGREAAAAPHDPPLGYHDFAQWTEQRQRNGEFTAGRAHFEQQLQDLPTTRLRPDHAKSAPNARGGRVRHAVDSEVGAALLHLSRTNDCTPFVTMLTGFVAALHRWTDEDDLVLGTPFANRNHPRLQHAFGLFVNSLVLRSRIENGTTFRSLLQQVRAVVHSAFAHGDVPFEHLVQHLAPERHLDRNPLFQVMFNFVDFADVDMTPAGMRWQYREAPAGTLFDFTLYVRQHGDSFVLESEFDLSLFEPATMARRLRELHTLLQAAVLDADRDLQALPLLSPDDLSSLQRWQAGAPLPPGPGDAWSLVREAVQQSTLAQVCDAEQSIDGAELVRLVTHLGSALRERGVQPGDRVAFFLPRDRWLPITALAIWHAGAACVPLDPSQPQERRSAILAAAAPKFVVAAEAFAAPTATLRLADLLRPGRQHPAIDPASSAAAYLLFTSGSTGEPKGVVVPHASLAAFLRAMRQTLPMTGSDTLLAITSPSFDIAWLEWLLPLCVGGSVRIAGEDTARDGTALARELAVSGATFLQATPSTYRLLLAAGFRGNEQLNLLSGGEALPDALAEQLRSCSKRLWNLYGPTETTIWSTVHEVGSGPVRIGRPIPGTNTFVVARHGDAMPLACPGELVIGGAGLALGYDGAPAATAERFVTGPDGNPAYRTGDLVRYDARGELQFLGRVDDQVKVRGHRIEPGAVEAWLAAHPSVRECAVQAEAHGDAHELVAHVVPNRASHDDTETWRGVWQQTYEHGTAPNPDFDHRGWVDSRTGTPLATDAMQRFVGHSVRRIQALGCRRVLEIGCGTGMLLAPLAATCERWHATDPTAAAVAAVASLAERRGLTNVTTQQLRADQLDLVSDGPFDCIVINSVAQYFPSLDYLLTVLAKARQLLAPNGVLFLGDIRLLPWQAAAAAWTELATTALHTPREVFAQAVQRRICNEPELLLAPGLFEELVTCGAFADRWIAIRAGDDDTEMDRFRADVVLTIDATFANRTSLPKATDNARVARSWHLAEQCENPELADVEALQAAADALAASATPACPPAVPASRASCARAAGDLPKAGEVRQHANVPHHSLHRLAEELRSHLRTHLPANIVPQRIHWHQQLPRLTSGKIDRRQLQATKQPQTSAAPVAAHTELEARLVSLFAEVLNQPAIGREHDFFASGGHSLAAARLVARIRDAFGIDLPLRQVFATPVLHELARSIATSETPSTRPPGPRPAGAPNRPGPTMQRLWFLQKLTAGSRAYLMIGVFDAPEAVDLDAMRLALADVAARHEVLRIRLEEHQGQAVLRATRDPIPFTHLPDTNRMAATLESITGDEMLPLQVFLADTAESHHRIAFVLHHAFLDGWSLTILRRDLEQAYHARRQQLAVDWPAITVSYLDFAHWQLEQDHEQARTFWRQELADLPPSLDLPTRIVRPPELRENGQRLAAKLDAALLAKAAQFAQQHGATTFLVFLSAFQLWLRRLSNQQDLVVGTTLANRGHAALEAAIGPFLQTMPVRAHVRDAGSFRELLAATKQTFLRCTEHAGLPFPQLLDAVSAPRALNRTPLFQTTLDWLNHPEHTVAAQDAWRECAYDPGTSKFDLSLIVTGTAPFTAFLEYRSDLFDKATVASWWQSFACLLNEALAQPERACRELPWVDAAEQQFLLEQGRGDSRAWPQPDVVRAWQDRVAKSPDAIAITCDGDACTYAAVQERVLQLAATLQQHGADSGQHIALCLPRSADQLIGMLAVLHIGCAYVPIAGDQPKPRITTMLARTGTTIGICLDPEAPPIAIDGIQWCTATGGDAAHVQLPDIAPSATAYVLFTSGSTGEPKGVAVSHRALANYVFWAHEHYGKPQSAPMHTPLGFDLTLTSLWPVWLAGGSVHVTAESDADAGGVEALFATSARAPFDLAKLTPAHLNAWHAKHPSKRLADRLVLGGEALHLEQLTHERTNGVTIWNEYGPTEATVGCAHREITTKDGRHGPAPIGNAIANVRLYVLDPQRRLVPRGVVGELWIAGASLAAGYVGRDDLTDQSFCDDAFVVGERMYRSGDYASWNSFGEHTVELHYHGRIDGQHKIRGRRIEVEDVRSCLLRLEAVADAAVTVQQAPSGSQQLIAHVVTAADVPDLRNELQQILPRHAIPTQFVPVTTLPLDANGKLDTSRLPSPWQATANKPCATDQAATNELLQLARELLRVPDLQPDDDFFRSGGDSILALQLVARAADLGLHLEIRDVFENATVASLHRVAATAQTVVAAKTSGGLLPMQRWFFEQGFTNRDLYDQAVWLAVAPEFQATTLQEALATIVARHHALRTAFEVAPDGVAQHVRPKGIWQFTTLDARNLSASSRAAALCRLEGSSDFDIAAGRVFAATFVAIDDETNWLYLRAHHLAVDAVSWVTLLTDLQLALTGAPLATAPPPPLAFVPSEPALHATAPATVDHVAAVDAGLEGSAVTCTHTFPANERRALHAARSGAHRIEALELLAAAAALAVPNPDGASLCRVDLEAHGRHGGSARTVGWFTEVYSVSLDVSNLPAADRLRRTKERVRDAKRAAHGRPPPATPAPILLNYLGAIFAGSRADDVLQPLTRDAGTLRAAENQRSHAFEVRAVERAGQLHVSFHAPDDHAAQLLAARFASALRQLVTSCSTEPAAPSYADYPLATLPAEQTNGLLEGRNDVEQVYPLSPTQQGMVFSTLEHPDAPIYREQLAAVIEGPLRVAELEQAFARTCARHELLRGEVHWRGLQEPHWLIPVDASLHFARTQLRCREDELESAAVRRRLAELRQSRFLFGRDPLLRIEVAQMADDRHALLVTYHHAILDGWSMPLLLQETVHHYRGLCGDALPELPPARPFAEHVAFLGTQSTTQQKAFWRERLATFTEPLRLRGDLTFANHLDAPAHPNYSECERWLTVAQTAALQTAGEQLRITTSTLLQTAWAIVLGRWSGQDDVLFGVTVAGRPSELPDVAQRIGLFINTLPLRIQVAGDLPVGEMLASVQREVVEMLAQQHTPLPISQAQTGVPAGTDAFETLLVFENYPLEESLRDLPAGLRVTATTAFERTNYALTLVAIPGERLCLRLLHQDDRFSPAFADQLLRSVETVLHQLAGNPRLRTRHVQWLTAADQQRAAQFAAGPQAQPERHVLQRVLATARENPDAIAVTAMRNGTEQSLSYRQLVQQAERIARRLVQEGASNDSLVAFRGERNPMAIAILLGIWRSGAAYLPIDPQWPEQQVADILAASQPVVVIDDTWAEHSHDPDHQLKLPPADDARALAYAIATSGTTGQAKIVRVEHASLANYVGAAIRQWQLTHDDRVLQFASFAFDTAAEEIWPTLCIGATLVLRDDDQASSSRAFLRACQRQRLTVWDLPTAFFHALFATGTSHTRNDLGDGLRVCIVGGQALEASAAASFLAIAPEVQLWNTYGPSEATIVATWCQLQDPPGTRPAIGTPIPGTEAWVLDADLHAVPPGLPGELCLLGAGLARDYVDPRATGQRFVSLPDGRRAFRTGDLARHRSDGQLEFLGRIDRQVKIAGVRIEPDAIEAMLSHLPGIREACVRCVTGTDGMQLIAFVETSSQEVTVAKVRAWLRSRLPAAAIPARIVTTDALPRLVSGKVDQQALHAPPQNTGAITTPSTPEEAAVVAIFAALFGNQTITVEDDFFDLGGSSLLAVRLLDALHKQFAVELSIQTVFAAPTPRGIALAVRSPQPPAAAVPLERMRADMQLGADFAVASKRAHATDRPNILGEIILTGATGFFGRHVLRELLDRGAERVHCLVRAEDAPTAEQRLARIMSDLGAPLDARVTVLCSDVAQPDLSLSPDQRLALGNRANHVVHAAAHVDFLRPYSQLREANVEGTRHIIAFCAEHDLPLHHVSSIGVFADPRASLLGTIEETCQLERFDLPVGGYAQSKWVSEQLVRDAGQRGLCATIHRPGRLVADSQTGAGNEHDFVTAMLLLCRDLGKVVATPELLEQRFDVTPVDYAARMLVAALTAPGAVKQTLHLVHPEPPTLAALVAQLRAVGWQLQATDWNAFCAAATSLLRERPDHPSAPLRPFLQTSNAILQGLHEPRFASQRTLAALGAHAPRRPTIDQAMLARWLRGLDD